MLLLPQLNPLVACWELQSEIAKGEYFMIKYKQETRKVYTVEPLLKDTPEVRTPG